MRFRMTVRGGSDGGHTQEGREVEVEAAPGTTASDLAAALGAGRLSVDGQVLAGSAPVGMPPLVAGALLTVAVGRDARPASATSSGWELWVVSGPDDGLRVALVTGRHVVGRSPTASVCLTDPDASRSHLEVDVAADAVVARDLGSANGTRLAGIPLGLDPTELGEGATVTVGSSTLRLHRTVRPPDRVRPDGAGHLVLNPGPARQRRPDPEPVAYPSPPGTPPRSRFPLVALVVPLVLAGAIAGVTRSPTMLLFGLSGPVFSLAAWVGQRRAGSPHRLRRDYEVLVAAADVALAMGGETERAALLADHPPPSAVLGSAQDRSARLWGSGDEVRVGLGARSPTTRVTGDYAPPLGPLEDAPITLAWSSMGSLGVVGARPLSLRAAANFVGRAVVDLPPGELRVCLVSSLAAREDWSWLARLPHAREVDEALSLAMLLEEIERREGSDAATLRPRILVVVDGPTGMDGTGLGAAVSRGPGVDVHVLVVASGAGTLPAGIDAQVTVETSTRAVLTTPGPVPSPVAFAPDLPSPAWATAIAAALCPLRDGTSVRGPGVVPGSVRLVDLVCPDGSLEADDLACRWQAHPRSTSAVLGQTADGPMEVDLTTEGPHALIAGTTGSGKSELLRTLVAGLALRNRPDEMVFVLVDYKGGATFRECARLPHVVGVVTDLDDHLTRRALVSLGAEVRRRERVLAAAGVGDLATYQRLGLAPLPRLVLVVDEFRVLAEELPDFVSGLVRLAAVGRSLGIHLVLATQRPGGIISADIRANVGLRVALRVRDRVDSMDVVESPAAALLPARTPGRAVLRGSSTGLVEFQTAMVSGASPPRLTGVRVTPVRPAWLDEMVASMDVCEPAVRDLDRVVVTATTAASRLGIPPVAAPWLPPLPDVVEAATLVGASDALALGLADDPAGQSQAPWLWDVSGGGHLGIAGGPGSGRTSAVLTVAAGIARTFSPAEVHLYVVGPQSLSSLEALPHLAGLATIDDVNDVGLVIGALHVALARRGAGRGPGPRWLVLLVDGWERLAGLSSGSVASELRPMLETGGGLGLRVVVTGGRAVLAGQLTSVLSERLVLRVSDPVDLTLAGLSASMVPSHQPPGRAVDVRTKREVQIAQVDGRHLAALPKWSGVGGPSRVRRLPAVVRRAEVVAVPGLLVVGVREGDLAPVGFSPERGHRRVVVVGPSRSGRTTALATLGEELLAAGTRVAVVGPALAERLPGALVFAPDQRDELVAARQTHESLALLVDDAERIDGQPIEAVIREIARLADESGGFVTASVSPLALETRGSALATELARSHTGLVLWPTDGAGLGARMSLGERIPGRGALVLDGAAQPLQVSAA